MGTRQGRPADGRHDQSREQVAEPAGGRELICGSRSVDFSYGQLSLMILFVAAHNVDGIVPLRSLPLLSKPQLLS